MALSCEIGTRRISRLIEASLQLYTVVHVFNRLAKSMACTPSECPGVSEPEQCLAESDVGRSSAEPQ